MDARTRGLRVAAALIAACSASACNQMASPARPSAAAAITAGASAEANGGQSDFASVRQATARFHDIDAAIAAGYASPIGGVCDSLPGVGTMGVHSGNLALISDGTLNPDTPEVLLYAPTGGGNYRLVAVEYLQPVLLRDTTNPTAPPIPWFAPTPWPPRYQPIGPAPSLFGQTFQGPMPGHVPGMPWHYDLHMWIWAPNPNGMFAQWNPSISCQRHLTQAGPAGPAG